MTPLNLNSFENSLADLNRQAKETPTIYVLNCRDSLANIVGAINVAIKNSAPNQLLHGIDLRTIFHSTGNAENWSLEACSPKKSLATTGLLPTA